jgi:hypothetical protein
MASQLTSYQVVLLTARHSITGELFLRDQRLSDYMNDRRETMVTLQTATVARLNDPGKILQQHTLAVVPKSWVVVAFEPPQKAIPAAHRFYGYIKKQTHDVFLVLEGMELRGILHTVGELDPRRFLGATTDTFLPITSAVITLYASDRYIIEQAAVMVNATLIRYLAKTESPKT